jgi:hypothetical protein
VSHFFSSFTHSELWSGAAGVLIGACIGACIPYLLQRCARRIERAGELVAIHAEFKHALEYMTALRTPVDGLIVLAPLYRLPTDFSDRAVPKLIGEGLLKPAEISTLIDYLVKVEELNRGLDRACNAANDNLVKDEYNRNKGKIGHILDDQVGTNGATRYKSALAAIERLQILYPPKRKS